MKGYGSYECIVYGNRKGYRTIYECNVNGNRKGFVSYECIVNVM